MVWVITRKKLQLHYYLFYAILRASDANLQFVYFRSLLNYLLLIKLFINATHRLVWLGVKVNIWITVLNKRSISLKKSCNYYYLAKRFTHATYNIVNLSCIFFLIFERLKRVTKTATLKLKLQIMTHIYLASAADYKTNIFLSRSYKIHVELDSLVAFNRQQMALTFDC